MTEAVSEFNPEVPFGVCDSVAAVAALKERLRTAGINVLPEVPGENATGKDCVFVALKYGVRAREDGRRTVVDVDTGEAVNLSEMSAQDVRNGSARYIRESWDKPNDHWAMGAVRVHIDNEGRAYLRMQNAKLTQVRASNSKTIRK